MVKTGQVTRLESHAGIYLAETGLRHFISHGSDRRQHISVTTNLDQRGKDDSETKGSAVGCSSAPRPSPGRSRDTVGFSGLSSTKNLPVGDTSISDLLGEGQRVQDFLERRFPQAITDTPVVVRLGMKLCLSGLIFTSPKLTWEQHNSFRPADKGTEASMC